MELTKLMNQLEELDGWELKEERLYREYEFSDFKEALEFINKVGDLAEEMDHHPEIYNVYNKVKLTLWTHSAGEITEKDIKLAKKIKKL